MTDLQAKHWLLPDNKAYRQIENVLKPAFALRKKRGQKSAHQLQDDYDWHLWHGGFRLIKTSEQEYKLISDEGLVHETVAGNPRFWWEFPEGELKETLKRTIKLRALNDICTLDISESVMELLDEEQKVVVRIKLTRVYKANADTASHQFVSVLPLRGYKAEFSKALTLCQPILPEETTEPNLEYLMQLQGLEIKSKASDTYGISAEEPCEKAVLQMCSAMFAHARTNEAGVISDIDTEFLHHYRVSIRKSRSLINLMKKAFAAEKHLQIKTQLAELASPTNPLRDLDVFLLDKSYYQSLLPDTYEAGLETLFNHIAKERQAAYKRVCTFFKSRAYTQKCKKLETLFSSEPEFASELAKISVLKIAKQRTLKRYKKICNLGNQIVDDTPDEEVHELRIECKKLRYLMEFFSELFPKKRISALIKSLKSLQTILGDFNDYSVQKEFLAQYLSKEKDAQVVAAINGLVAVLHQKQLQERARVCTAFAAFSEEAIATEFQQLFAQ